MYLLRCLLALLRRLQLRLAKRRSMDLQLRNLSKLWSQRTLLLTARKLDQVITLHSECTGSIKSSPALQLFVILSLKLGQCCHPRVFACSFDRFTLIFIAIIGVARIFTVGYLGTPALGCTCALCTPWLPWYSSPGVHLRPMHTLATFVIKMALTVRRALIVLSLFSIFEVTTSNYCDLIAMK